MKTYEITFITLEDVKDKPAKDIILAVEGKILNTSLVGEKQFAYKIKKADRGFYTTILFEMDPAKFAELNKKLSLQEDILRFLITVKKPFQLLPKKEKIAPEIAAPKEISEPEEIEAKPVKEEKVAPRATSPGLEIKPKTVKKPAKVKEEKVKEIEAETESEEDRLKELDKKLDELLKE